MAESNLDENNKYLKQNSQMSQAVNQLKIKLQELNKQEEIISQGKQTIAKVKEQISQSQNNIQSRRLTIGKAEELKRQLNNDNQSMFKRINELEEKENKEREKFLDISRQNGFEEDLKNVKYRTQLSATVLEELRVLKESEQDKVTKKQNYYESQQKLLQQLKNEGLSKEKALENQIRKEEEEISNLQFEKDQLEKRVHKEDLIRQDKHYKQRSNAEREVLEEKAKATKIQQESEKDHIEMLKQKKIQLQPEVDLLKNKLNFAEVNCMNAENNLNELHKQFVQQNNQTEMIQWMLVAVVIFFLFQEFYKFVF